MTSTYLVSIILWATMSQIVSNFDYDDGNLGVVSGKIESELSLVYGSRWSDWIEGGDADQQFISFDGNDRIYADGGFDTVLFSGDAGEFSFKFGDDYSGASALPRLCWVLQLVKIELNNLAFSR